MTRRNRFASNIRLAAVGITLGAALTGAAFAAAGNFPITEEWRNTARKVAVSLWPRKRRMRSAMPAPNDPATSIRKKPRTMIPSQKKIITLSKAMEGGGSAEQGAELGGLAKRAAPFGAINDVLLFVILYLMVFKPGL